MAFTEYEMKLLNKPINLELFNKIPGLNCDYYLKPYLYIRDELGLTLNCTGQEYRFAVEMANDEDVLPPQAELPVIVDGVLAFLYADELEECGISLLNYFSYLFRPDPEFQSRLERFENMIREVGV